MDKWSLVIDVAKCEECNNCFLACKDEHVDNDFLPFSLAQPRHGHRWIDVLCKERGQCPRVDAVNLPVPCMHCDNAPCIKKAPNGAVYKGEEGFVIIDPAKAKGQKELVDSCPYGAIWWNEEKEVPQKCTFCAHLLKNGWKEPRCVQACPTGAMQLLRMSDSRLKSLVKQQNLEVFHTEYKTQPRIYYKNLYRYTSCFIGGDVAYPSGGLTDCAEGAQVALFKNGTKMAETVTDNYGDFRFDGLPENSGSYRVEVSFGKYAKRSVDVELKTSQNVPTIKF